MKKQQSFNKDDLIGSSLFYSFQEDAIIKFEHLSTATNKLLSNVHTYSKRITQNTFIGITLDPKFQLGIYDKIQDKYALKSHLLSQNTGIKFLDLILQKYLKGQDKRHEIIGQVFEAFEKEAINRADLVVSDIYGPDSSSIGIPGYILASSLGRLAQKGVQNYQKTEIIRSILIGFSLSIAQITGLNSIKHKINHIVMLQNPLQSMIFTQYIYTFLKFYNPDSNVLFKNYKVTQVQ